MKLSIIIPNYNGEKTIKKTLQSIYSAKLKDFEIIIIDDASTDDSVKIIKNYPVKLIELKKNKGASHARNIGIEKSKHGLLLFVDSDIVLKNIDKLFEFKEDICYPNILNKNNEIVYPITNNEKKYPHISACFLVKKKSLKNITFDENFETYLEDIDFFIRCKLSGLSSKYVDKAYCIHIKNKQDNLNRYYKEIKNINYGIKKYRWKKIRDFDNPFRKIILIKLFFYGLINFAWFDWQNNHKKNIKNLIFALKHNKISKKSRIPSFFKAIKDSNKVNYKNNSHY